MLINIKGFTSNLDSSRAINAYPIPFLTVRLMATLNYRVTQICWISSIRTITFSPLFYVLAKHINEMLNFTLKTVTQTKKKILFVRR